MDNFDNLFVNSVGCVTDGEMKVDITANVLPADLQNRIQNFENQLGDWIDEGSKLTGELNDAANNAVDKFQG